MGMTQTSTAAKTPDLADLFRAMNEQFEISTNLRFAPAFRARAARRAQQISDQIAKHWH